MGGSVDCLSTDPFLTRHLYDSHMRIGRKKPARSIYSMHVFSKSFCFLTFLQPLICLLTQCPHGQGERMVEQQAKRTDMDKGGRELKTDKIMWTSFMGSP